MSHIDDEFNVCIKKKSDLIPIHNLILAQLAHETMLN